MEPKFQTSFIPQKTIATDAVSSHGVIRETNAVLIIANIVLVVTLLASASLFGYRLLLLKQISDADTNINTARASFQVDKIKDLINANNRITATKDLLDKHVVTSKLLYLFQDLTLKNIRILKLTYVNKADIPTVSIAGEAKSYNALVVQSSILSTSEYLKNTKFSGFNLQENGDVRLDFSTTVDTSLLSYKKAVEPQASSEDPSEVPPQNP